MTDPPSSAQPPVTTPRKRARPRCPICGKEARTAMRFDAVRPEIAALIAADHPDLKPTDYICERHVDDCRTRYVANLLASERGELSELEKEVVQNPAAAAIPEQPHQNL